MTGFYEIPTRRRRSTWYLVEGTLSFFPDEPIAQGSLPTGVVDLSLPSGAVVRILPKRTLDYSFRVLYHAIHRASSAPVRVLLRKIERPDSVTVWDVLLSLNGALTMSVADQCLNGMGVEVFRSLVDTVLAEATQVAWPSWIPNDESSPTAPEPPPPMDYPEVWDALVKAIKATLPLEKDQVFWNLRLERLKMDSLDAVQIIMALEEDLHVEIPDEQAERLFSDGETVGDSYARLVDLVEK